MNTTEFIKAIGICVQKYAPAYGICVHSPIIAQAVLESARGTSELAVNANNYFGLKSISRGGAQRQTAAMPKYAASKKQMGRTRHHQCSGADFQTWTPAYTDILISSIYPDMQT